MYLKQPKLVTNTQHPSLISSMTHPISEVLVVNGAAILASASDNEIQMSAILRVVQSFAPSPLAHMRTVYVTVYPGPNN